jgi:hypothetical protein
MCHRTIRTVPIPTRHPTSRSRPDGGNHGTLRQLPVRCAGRLSGFAIDDEDDWECTLEWLRDDLSRRHSRISSLEPHEGWRGREDRILLRNGYADFGLSIYGGLAAVWIVERDDTSYHEAELRRRCMRWRSAGSAALPGALTICSANTCALATCRMAKASIASGIDAVTAAQCPGGGARVCRTHREITHVQQSSSSSGPEQVQRDRTEQIARLNDETRQGKARRSRILFTRGVVELLAEGQTEEPARTARS